MDAIFTIARKLRAVFSYRVATRRYTFILAQNRSTKFRSLYRSRSIARGSRRRSGSMSTAAASFSWSRMSPKAAKLLGGISTGLDGKLPRPMTVRVLFYGCRKTRARP